jgi:ribose 5-phosphate isomerase B
MIMRVAVACDHAGFPLKEMLLETVKQAGHSSLDLGTFNTEAVDYPDFAEKIGHALQNGEAQRAILVCGSGVGACIAANKMRGIMAGICHDTYSAHQAVEHDDMNVLCLGARVIGPDLAHDIVLAFLAAEFSHAERHVRRIAKIKNIEEQLCKS